MNLPAKLKMSPPRYQEIRSEDIPVLEKGGARIRLVAGSVGDVPGPVKDIAIGPLYIDVSLDSNTTWEQVIPREHTLRIYIFEGMADFGVGKSETGELINAVTMLSLENGEALRVKTSKDSGVRFMMISGMPIKEPIVPYGPFVMNTADEIQQALVELRNGTFIRSTS